MGDKGEGGVKNLKKWVTSFMDGLSIVYIFHTAQQEVKSFL